MVARAERHREVEERVDGRPGDEIAHAEGPAHLRVEVGSGDGSRVESQAQGLGLGLGLALALGLGRAPPT